MKVQLIGEAIESKASQYGLPNTENGLSTHDKQPLPAKKIVLRDLQNENPTVISKPAGPIFSKDNGPASKIVKALPNPDCQVSPSHHQYPSSNGHLVYARRKAEVDLSKTSSIENTSINADSSQLKKLHDHDSTNHQKAEMKDVPVLRGSPVCFPSVKLNNGLPNPDSSNVNVNVNAASVSSSIDVQPWEQRFLQLQNLLKKLDQSSQEDYMQMLRSLSSVELSKHAVDLERRSIQLSLDEAKEMHRVRLLDVLGKYPKSS